MPDSAACFCTFHAGSLEFPLPSAWRGTVKVVFTGNHVKHVDVHHSDPHDTTQFILEGRYSYCENPTPPPHTIPVNPTPLPITYRITPFHAARFCGKDNLGDTTLTIANLDLCTDTGIERRARWTFPLGSGGTVQIVVAIEDESSGGGLLIRVVDFIRMRGKKWFEGLFRRSDSN